MERLGKDEAKKVAWNGPADLIAGDFPPLRRAAFSKSTQIELMRYRKYGRRVPTAGAHQLGSGLRRSRGHRGPRPRARANTRRQRRPGRGAPGGQGPLRGPEGLPLGLGDDVLMKAKKFYFAFKRIKLRCSRFIQTKAILVLRQGDRILSGHRGGGWARASARVPTWGTLARRLEIRIHSDEDLEKAKPLILRSYEAS